MNKNLIIIFAMTAFSVIGIQAEQTPASSQSSPARKIDKQIVINLSNQILTIFSDGVVRFSCEISSGKPGFETPEGTTTVIDKKVDGYSKKYDCPTPYMLELGFKDKNGVLRGIRIHEGIVYARRYPLSHACIRVPKGKAKQVYDLCPIGTQVTTTGSIFDYLEKNFDGFSLLEERNNELRFKLNADGSLPQAFINAYHRGMLQLCQIDPKTGKYTDDRSKWLIGWQFLEIKNCIPVPKYERQTGERVRLRRPGE